MRQIKLALVLLACFVGSLCGYDASASKTIYAVSLDNWQVMYAHCWNGSGSTTGEFCNDKEKMSATSDTHEGKTVYSMTVDDTYTKMMLACSSTGNNNKSVEVDIADNTLYIIKNSQDNAVCQVETKANYKQTSSVPTVDLYIRGDFTKNGNDSWGAVDDYKLTKNGNVYSRTFASFPTGSFKISTNSWSGDHTYTTNNTAMAANVAYDCPVNTDGEANMGLAAALTNVTVTLDFSGSTPKLTFKTQGGQESNVPTDDLYIRGGFTNEGGNSWAAVDSYKFTKNGSVFTATFSELPGGEEFKIGSKTTVGNEWKYGFSTTNNAMEANTPYNCPSVTGQDTNMKLKETLTNVTVTLDFSGATPVLTFTTQSTPGPIDPDPVDPDDPDANTYIIYIVNKTDWSSIYAHYWELKNGNVIGTTVWPGHEVKLVATGETYENQPVYSVTLTAGYDANKIIFSHNGAKQTGNDGLDLVNGNLYIISSDGACTVTTRQEYGHFDTKPVPVPGRTVYFEFGQDRSNKGNKAELPRIVLWNSKKGANDTPSKSDMRVMYHCDDVDGYHDLWYYVVDESEVGNVKDFSFIYYMKEEYQPDNRDFEYYTAGAAGYNEMNKLYEYIYTTHNGNIAVQSYVKPEQYMPLRKAEKKELYVYGTGLSYNEKKLGWIITEEPVVIPADTRGEVFYLPVNWNSELHTTEGTQGAAFKISWIRPSDFSKSTETDRLWATFNIGIVGYARSRNEAVIDKDDWPSVTPDPDGANWNVQCKTSWTYRFNNHDQYNWFIPKSEATTTDYLLIIDLDEDCQSATLLSFTPHPQATASNAVIEPKDLIGPMTAHSGSLTGESVNGAIQYLHANMVSANVNIETQSESILTSNKYTAAYQLYSNGERLGQPVAQPTGLRVRGMAIGDGATMGVRAKYTDTKTGFTFHTKYSEAAVEANVFSRTQPSLKLLNKTYVDGQQNLGNEILPSERWYTLGAYATLQVEHNKVVTDDNKELVHYVDIDAECEGRTGAELIHDAHSVKVSDRSQSVIALGGWQKLDEDSEYFDDAHNWSKIMATATSWPVHMADVVKVQRDENNVDISTADTFNKTVTVKARYVYPLVIDTEATPQIITANAPMRKAEGENAEEDNDGWRLVLLNGPVTELPVTFRASEDLTGISDAIVADADAPVEYYNLQGMRLSEAPAAGFCIRRQGSKVEKILIR